MKTCLNRFLRRCVGCVRDYDRGHHPNNLDCIHYREIEVLEVNVVNVKKSNNSSNSSNSSSSETKN